MIKKLRIEGMSCKHCVMHVTKALEEIKGVNHVKVDLKSKDATVEATNDVSENELVNAVTETGYQVISVE